MSQYWENLCQQQQQQQQHGGDDAAADADIYVRYLFMHQICYSQISVIIVLIMEIKFYPSMFEMISICIGKCACLSYNQENRSSD